MKPLRAWYKKLNRMFMCHTLEWSGDRLCWAILSDEKGFLYSSNINKHGHGEQVDREDLILLKPYDKPDKNGKEIYEGNILRDDVGDLGIVRFGKLPFDKSGDCVCNYLAFYVECKGQIGRAPTYECTEIGDWMEVIGTIYENPGLLGETK